MTNVLWIASFCLNALFLLIAYPLGSYLEFLGYDPDDSFGIALIPYACCALVSLLLLLVRLTSGSAM